MTSGATPQYEVVIVGGGHAGVNLVANLAKGGFPGSVALLSDESCLPYKRPPLSKGFLLGTEPVDSLHLRSEDYWRTSSVELIRGAWVEQVRPDAHVVRTGDGREIGYGTLVWAAGGRARRLPVPGADLDGVHLVRTLSDVERLKRHLPAAGSAVIVGGGYIGLEVAAAVRGQGLAVTVLEAAPRVLPRVTSPEVSAYFSDLHRAAGVEIMVDAQVTELRGTRHVAAVALADGREIPADLVVVGVGLQANDEPLRAAGATCGDGVHVDELCRTTVPGVLAAGDCTNQELPGVSRRRVRLESLQNANEQAKVVASVLLGAPAASTAVPWFWSDQYTTKLKTVGLVGGHDTTVVRGDPGTGTFSVLYLSAGRLVALDTINNAADFAHGRAAVGMSADLEVDVEALADPARPLRDCVRVGL